MERTTKIIRPPQVHDLWYVKVHHAACTVELDTVLVLEQTQETVKLLFTELAPVNGEPQWARYKTTDVVWVEHIGVQPHAAEKPTCQISPLRVTVHRSAHPTQDKPQHSDPLPVPPPTKK